MEFTYNGFDYWFCLGDSRFYKMDKKSYVVAEISKYEFYAADAESME